MVIRKEKARITNFEIRKESPFSNFVFIYSDFFSLLFKFIFLFVQVPSNPTEEDLSTTSVVF